MRLSLRHGVDAWMWIQAYRLLSDERGCVEGGSLLEAERCRSRADLAQDSP
jgi:hypothetical protein